MSAAFLMPPKPCCCMSRGLYQDGVQGGWAGKAMQAQSEVPIPAPLWVGANNVLPSDVLSSLPRGDTEPPPGECNSRQGARVAGEDRRPRIQLRRLNGLGAVTWALLPSAPSTSTLVTKHSLSGPFQGSLAMQTSFVTKPLSTQVLSSCMTGTKSVGRSAPGVKSSWKQ